MVVKKHSIEVFNHKGEKSIMTITKDYDLKYPLGSKELKRTLRRTK